MNISTRPDIVTHYVSGKVRLREVIRIVLYFNEPHLSMASKIHEVLLKFVDLISLEALGYFYNLEGEAVDISPESFSNLMNVWFFGSLSKYPNATIEIIGHEYLAPEYGVNYCGKFLDNKAFPDDTGFLHLWMPRQFFLANSTAVDSYFYHALSRLPACSGYMSPGLSDGDMSGKQALARRYPGLDIALPSPVSIDLGTKCPGSYWKTFLGPEIVMHLGGIQAIRDALVFEEDSFRELQNGGLLIQLTALPELGDRNRQEVPAVYEYFARFLHERGSLHVPRKVVYFQNEEGFADLEAQEGWHLRFIIE